MKKFRGIGNLGLSLVELIISMAILAVVGTTIGGAMYVSSRSYTRGSAEINVQEEAQIASNLICDWIVDATSVNPDGSGGYITGDSTSLVIIHPEGEKLVEITVQQSGSELTYVAKDVTDPSDAHYNEVVGNGVLAKNLTGCFFYSTFGDDRNVRISLDFNVNDRTYRAVTDTTSRSHDFISTGGTSVLAGPSLSFGLVSMDGGAHITLEPGQNTDSTKYTFFVYVDGCDVDSLISPGVTYTAPSPSNTTIESCTRVGTTNAWKVVIKSDADASHDDQYVFTARNAAGPATAPLTVKIRRVTKCEFAAFDYENPSDATSEHVWNPSSGNPGKNHAVYTNSIDLGLGSVNWQNESSQIIGTDSSIPGGLGYDASPWGWQNPANLSVKLMYKSGNTWHGVPSSTATVTVDCTTASPSIRVNLNSDLSSDIYCVVVATHSGTISGNANNANDPYKGFSSPIATNKATVFGGTTLNYGDGGHAYYTVIKIKKGGGELYPQAGGGIRRGTPACMICNVSPNARSTILNDIKDITRNNANLHTFNDDNSIVCDNGAHLKYCTILYYTPIDAQGHAVGPEKYFVVSNITNFGQLFQDDGQNSDFVDRRIRDATSSIFKLNQAYSVNFQMNVYCDGTLIKTYPHAGSVVAATPYVYDPSDKKFHNGTYTQSDPYIMTGSGRQEFGVYVDGCSVKTDRIKFKCQYLSGNTWVDDTNNVINEPGDWYEGGHDFGNGTISQVVLDDGRRYTIGNYNENEPNINDVMTSIESFTIDKSKMVTGRLYRVVFDTDWKEAVEGRYSIGVIGGAYSQVVSVNRNTDMTTNNYSLGGSWYFKK